ncbi:hypothetical protein AMTR_s00059p00118280 [Amborella trichopoda]|uniref:Flavin-containing monooxygenase n=1 Tax=Amborella trichopoda TaxID=13333 RepID=U5D822_AMBTC|nr:hypothetical protein AMTR_s00059p00118280 [Amborella trichopoda]
MKRRSVWVAGPVIVGAGPSGLAVAACLRNRGIPFLSLERAHCVASLWKLKTCDRLKLPLPKSFCQLPLMPFPETSSSTSKPIPKAFWPDIRGLDSFPGSFSHSSMYKNGEEFRERKVLAVGCGNSGMEVGCSYSANVSMVVRDKVHILARGMKLLKWLPLRWVDCFLLLVSWFLIGNTGKLGLERPRLGPLELMRRQGKTPVLDVGTLDKIKTRHIKVVPGIKRFNGSNVEFVDGKMERFDSGVLATGYQSNVPSWLKEGDMSNKKGGVNKRLFPNGWKGERGLYAVGFTKGGLQGISMDAIRVAEDIASIWKSEAKLLALSHMP